MSDPQPSHWFDYFIKLFGQVTTRQWRRFFSRLVVSIVVALTISTLVLYLAIKFFGFRVQEGKLYLGVYESNLSALVHIDATAGWQGSGIKLKQGDRLKIEPSGRIHLAANHTYHLAQVSQPLIISKLPNRNWSPTLLQRYRPPKFDDSNVFYRNWIGPEGENIQSDILDGCKIRPDLSWGELLATVLPNKVSDQIDPLRVLKDAGLSPSELVPVPNEIEFTAARDGELAFIINEAVLSEVSDSKDSQDFYAALISAKADLSNDPRHQLYAPAIPLIWFADNLGSFRASISRIP